MSGNRCRASARQQVSPHLQRQKRGTPLSRGTLPTECRIRPSRFHSFVGRASTHCRAGACSTRRTTPLPLEEKSRSRRALNGDTLLQVPRVPVKRKRGTSPCVGSPRSGVLPACQQEHRPRACIFGSTPKQGIAPRCEASGVFSFFIGLDPLRRRCAAGGYNPHLFTIHYSLFMIYAPISTPAQLLAVLPHLLDTKEEAEEFWKYINEGLAPARDLYLDDFSEEHAKAYTSLREAFEDLYPGDIDDWKADRCGDYQCCFSDFTGLYEDWLFENHTCRWICDKLIVQHS